MNTNGRSFNDYSKEKGTICECLCLDFDQVDELTKMRYFFKVRGKYCLAQCMHAYDNYKTDVECGCIKPLKGHEYLLNKPAKPDPAILKRIDQILKQLQRA